MTHESLVHTAENLCTLDESLSKPPKAQAQECKPIIQLIESHGFTAQVLE